MSKRLIITLVICGVLVATPSLTAETLPFIVPTNQPVTCAESAERCDLALKAALTEIDARKAQYNLLSEYTKKVEEQRDKAYKELEPGQGIPWWVWTMFGAAAGVVLTRGVR